MCSVLMTAFVHVVLLFIEAVVMPMAVVIHAILNDKCLLFLSNERRST